MSQEKPKEILQLEKIYGITLQEIQYEIDLLYSSQNNTYLLNNQKEVIGLNLSQNQITEIKGVELFKKLKVLNLSENEISKLEGLDHLTQLKKLDLSNNQIKKIEGLDYLIQLKELYLSDNQIKKIEGLEYLTQLKDLYLFNNQIKKIEGLGTLKQLECLNVSYNDIKKIEGLEYINQLSFLGTLSINHNPFLQDYLLELKDGENHLSDIKNLLSKIKESQKKIYLPVKVMLLGNHASGKSTFLHYYKTGSLSSQSQSTHVLSIQEIKDGSKNELPKSIFFDFGGQDYYHGIYQAFFSLDSINLLFWQQGTDKIEQKPDSVNDKTTHLNRKYWLGQIHYAFKRLKQKEEEPTQEPLIMVQTHADDPDHRRELCNTHDHIINEYFISLQKDYKSSVNSFMLDALRAQINEEIDKKYHEISQPYWYEDFITHIYTTKGHNRIPITDLLQYYKRKNLNEGKKLEYLKSDLQQLARKGLVLYYKDDALLQDVVWLSPAETVAYIHTHILKKDNVKKKKGKLTEKEINTLIKDNELKQLLLNEKILFYDKDGDPEYIIPNYLPLAKEDKEIYDLMVFDYQKPSLSIKFEAFISFGFINLLICEFGKNPHSKHYWRDQFIFTYKDCKVWIRLLFEELKIEIYLKGKHDNTNTKEIEKELFEKIMYLYEPAYYHAIHPLSESEEESNLKAIDHPDVIKGYKINKGMISLNRNKSYPMDGIYISKDNYRYVSINSLETAEKNTSQVISYPLTKDTKDLDIAKGKYMPVNPFVHLILNENLKIMKKIFISYSHRNYAQRDRLLTFLKNMEREKKIQIWQDLQLQAGVEVEKEILDKLEEADIVILLVSQDFVASDFIYDKELPNAMKKKLNQKGEIIPILLSASTIFDLDLDITQEEEEEKENNTSEPSSTKIRMGKYYFLPQDEKNNLKPLLEWEDEVQQDKAWYSIYQHIKKTVDA